MKMYIIFIQIIHSFLEIFSCYPSFHIYSIFLFWQTFRRITSFPFFMSPLFFPFRFFPFFVSPLFFPFQFFPFFMSPPFLLFQFFPTFLEAIRIIYLHLLVHFFHFAGWIMCRWQQRPSLNSSCRVMKLYEDRCYRPNIWPIHLFSTRFIYICKVFQIFSQVF